MIDYIIAVSDENYQTAAILFKEYAEAINIDLQFQHFAEELINLKKMYGHPDGGIILCKENETPIGCVAIRRIDSNIAELKRMFIQPAFQNKGIGKELMKCAITLAKECGYQKVRLDTLDYMLPAINLYKKFGFYEILPYYFNPITSAVFFEMIL